MIKPRTPPGPSSSPSLSLPTLSSNCRGVRRQRRRARRADDDIRLRGNCRHSGFFPHFLHLYTFFSSFSFLSRLFTSNFFFFIIVWELKIFASLLLQLRILPDPNSSNPELQIKVSIRIKMYGVEEGKGMEGEREER